MSQSAQLAESVSPVRVTSPGRREQIPTEVNRALARELYVDQIVNVVDPSSRRSGGGKVVPGQMNLFHPKPLKRQSSSKKGLDSSGVGEPSTRANINQLQEIYNDEAGPRTKMRNPELQMKTEAIQKEFEDLMQEMVSRRSGVQNVAVEPATADQVLDTYYLPGPERRHKSPTRRLINHKNSTTDHKKRI